MQWSRKRCVQVVGMAAIVSLSNVPTLASQAPEVQPVPAWILQALDGPSRRDTGDERARALREIERSETLRENDQVRMALIGALGRANDQYQASFLEGTPEYGEGQGELHRSLLVTVIQLDDVRAIPALVGALDSGEMAQQAVTAFGEQALDPLITAWERRPTTPQPRRVIVGLGLLAAVAHLAVNEELDDIGRERVIAVARDVLAMPNDHRWFLLRAIDLAVSLADPALVAQVEAIAQDPQELHRRGISPDRVDFVMRYARRALDEGLEQGR